MHKEACKYYQLPYISAIQEKDQMAALTQVAKSPSQSLT